MKDIPMFTTEYGIASLTLGQVPYTATAYIRLQATEQPAELLQECKKTVGVKRCVSVIETGNCPMLVGIVKPAIILPDGYKFCAKTGAENSWMNGRFEYKLENATYTIVKK